MRHLISIGVISSVLATSAGVGYWHLAGRTTFPEGLIQTSGRLEGDVATVAILVTTHYMSEAEHCDHLVLMHAGRVISDASLERLKQEVEQEAGQLLQVSTDQPLPALQVLRRVGLSFLNGSNSDCSKTERLPCRP